MDDKRLVEKIEALERRIEEVFGIAGTEIVNARLEAAQKMAGIVVAFHAVVCLLTECRFTDRRQMADALETLVTTEPHRAHVDSALVTLIHTLRAPQAQPEPKEQLSFSVIDGGKSPPIRAGEGMT